MQSDTERRLVLAGALQHRALADGDLPAALGETLGAFTSDTEKRLVLQTLTERPRLTSAQAVTVARLAGRIGSDTDVRLVLQSLAEHHRLNAAGREAYMAAARTIQSDTDQALALRALLEASPQSGAASPPARASASTGTSLSVGGISASRTRSGRLRWNADVAFDRDGHHYVIQAKNVIYAGQRSNVLEIEPGGRLVIEERRPNGDTCRVQALRGRGGRPVYTYWRNGQVQPLTDEERTWMTALITEFTGS
jgi:hypothetical protein